MFKIIMKILKDKDSRRLIKKIIIAIIDGGLNVDDVLKILHDMFQKLRIPVELNDEKDKITLSVHKRYLKI